MTGAIFAARFFAFLQAIIAELQAGGASLRAVAAELTARSIPTAAGRGEWTAMGVRRVIKRAAAG